jgi:hypothetical protein
MRITTEVSQLLVAAALVPLAVAVVAMVAVTIAAVRGLRRR